MPVFYVGGLLAGLMAGVLVFWKIRRLPPAEGEMPVTGKKISIIIPARNEANNVGNLLQDLQSQQGVQLEIICVDDGSTDSTADVVQGFGLPCITIQNKPDGWTGKTFACQTGAQAATGDVLMFIDADVRMGAGTIQALAAQHGAGGQVVSVQPYHSVTKFYEHFAMFFNAVGVAANGVACPLSTRKAGLFGPVIVMGRQQFAAIDGFEQVRTSVIEDVKLGKVLEQHGLPYDVYVGDKRLSFTMYQNFKELFLGFVKNYSSGAASTPLFLLVLTLLWLTAVTAAPIVALQGLLGMGAARLVAGLVFYALFCVQMLVVLPRIGSFKPGYICMYPVFLVVFHGIFFYSLYAKLFTKKVQWKGRDISLD